MNGNPGLDGKLWEFSKQKNKSHLFRKVGGKMDERSNEDDEILAQIQSEIDEIEQKISHLKSRKSELLAKKNSILSFQEEKLAKERQQRNWEGEEFPWAKKLRKVAQESFNISTFRSLQLSAMNALLSKLDVFLIMPTGGGKSLCFQLPSLIHNEGLTLVVSPLVALMEDQVAALRKLGIQAEMLNADTPKDQVTRVLNEMTNASSGLRLLYVTPEKLAKSKRFMNKLQKCHQSGLFAHLAIDEVHCCSQWGHDFRPDYKFLGVMKNLFPNVPIIGLTATSTTQVTEDCKKMLNLKNCVMFRAPLNRPNLFYEVRPKPENQEECVNEIARMLSIEFKNSSGIIYTLTIKEVESLTQNLREKGLRVAPYHANLEAKYRSKVHQKWVSGDYQAVVATIAFGMGIDKPDVRFVIHHSISKSMENFYQESGRAGRDDKMAKCITFFKFSDIFRISTMVFTEQTGLTKLYQMVAYCINFQRCRRKMIAEQFGEEWTEDINCSNMCDNCKSPKSSTEVDITCHVKAIRNILSTASNFDTKLTSLKLVNAFLGKGETRFRDKSWNPGKLTRPEAEYIISHMLLEYYLVEDFAFTPYSTISYILSSSKPLPSSIRLSILSEKRKLNETDSETTSKQPKKSKRTRIDDDIICLSDDE